MGQRAGVPTWVGVSMGAKKKGGGGGGVTNLHDDIFCGRGSGSSHRSRRRHGLGVVSKKSGRRSSRSLFKLVSNGQRRLCVCVLSYLINEKRRLFVCWPGREEATG